MRDRSAGHGRKVIRISIEKLEPLTGSATADTGAKLRFEGWLELLTALSRLSDSAGDPSRGTEQDRDNEL